jgi:D-alanyl-D-alanine dipeptidase
MWKFVFTLMTMTTVFMPLPVYAQTCLELLHDALRLVLVRTSAMNTPTANLELFERTSREMPWTQVSDAEPAVVGHAGLGWGFTFLKSKQDGEPEKIEGDDRTPAGFFRIGPSFGFAASPLRGHVVLNAGETVCVDDPSSSFYNQVKKRAQIGPNVSREEMWRIPIYRRGLFIDYPTDRGTRRGSCIFVHVWREPNKGTAGCVAIPESRVAALQEFSEPGAVLAVLPEPALDRFADCLPNVPQIGKSRPAATKR